MQTVAAVLHETAGPFRLEDVELDTPADDEVLVEIAGAGMCHTDLLARDGAFPCPLPLVCGHEGAGVVLEVGRSVSKVAPGDRVALTYDTCGSCESCLRGHPAYCSSMFQRSLSGARADGSTTMRRGGEVVHGSFFGQSSFARHALARERNTVKIEADVPLHLLGPLGCGVQTGAGAVLNVLKPSSHDTLAIFGAGSVGLSALLAAQAVGGLAGIVVVDRNESRLALASDLGATHVVLAGDDVPAQIQALTGGGVSCAIEAAGVPQVIRQAFDSLRVGGVCVTVGAPPFGSEVSVDANSLVMGRTLRGVIEGDSVPDLFIPELVRLFAAGRFPFDRLVTEFAFDDINAAAHAMHSGEVVKPVLRP